MMDKKIVILLVIIIILLLVLYYYRHTIKVNWVVFLTVMRGILVPKCFWWKVSDLYKDTSGVHLYQEVKRIYAPQKIVPTNIFGTRMYIITDIDFIKQILDNSPSIFGVGKLKYDFFKSFMKDNVGVSEGVCNGKGKGCPWSKRRKMNEYVLDSDKVHRYSDIFEKNITSLMNNNVPTKFDDFGYLGKKMAMKLVFNKDEIYEPIFDMFSQSNSLNSIIFGSTSIDETTKNKYMGYLKEQMANPKKNSLVYLAMQYNKLSNDEILHQIPHWIFPIAGAFTVAVPRLLLVLFNHPRVLKKVVREIKTKKKFPYLRKCILELFRLNNPVNSTFRTLLSDYNFSPEYKFRKGDQFLILNNPIMREPEKFKNPNQYIPGRWTKDLESSYYAIMFNQGPQRCPGKELVIFIMQTIVSKYLTSIDMNKIKFYPKLDTSYIPQMINPCTITFSF